VVAVPVGFVALLASAVVFGIAPVGVSGSDALVGSGFSVGIGFLLPAGRDTGTQP
jgi:hypothetical protein